MGQVISSILSCVCGEEAEADEYDYLERRISTDISPFLISPPSPPAQTLQTLPSSLPCSSSDLESSASYVSTQPPPPRVDSPRDSSCLDESLQEEKKVVSLKFSEGILNLKQPSERENEEIDDDDDDDEVEEKVVIVYKEVVIEEIWMKHYSSFQKILLVGEGDFSFSASLAMAFGSATNIIATSLDSSGFLSRNYRNAMSNIQRLKNRGAQVMHEVDATEMANNFLFQGLTFDRIVFNFPHSGFISHETRNSQLERHRKLVRLFMSNAKKMITEKGEIHVSHKSNGFFQEWNLEQLASSQGLRLIRQAHFNYADYPGYRTKYGFGGDKFFNCNPSRTYTFGLQKF